MFIHDPGRWDGPHEKVVQVGQGVHHVPLLRIKSLIHSNTTASGPKWKNVSYICLQVVQVLSHLTMFNSSLRSDCKGE